MQTQVRLKKDTRIQAKYVHVTLHKLSNDSKAYWLEKGMAFRSNTVACLVGMEENHEEDKELHAHIIIQFSTKQKLTREQFVKHFGIDSLHIATKPNKEALMMALGYISKTGNTEQRGVFTHRGIELDTNPEVYRFQYQVQGIDDGLSYFRKVIKEHIGTKEGIIKKAEKRDDAIGSWLQKHQGHFKTLKILEKDWKQAHKNNLKKGIYFHPWVDDKNRILKEYKLYLSKFGDIFKLWRQKNDEVDLEPDFDQYVTHDLKVLRIIIDQIKEGVRCGHARPHKSLNLYLWSENPSFGKTRLLTFLNDNMRAYRLPSDQYYVDYDNFCYDVLISDEATEFIRTKSYPHLKLLFEGQDVEFNRKNVTKVVKRDNPLIVLAENRSFDELMSSRYPDVYSQAVMATRVLDLEIKSRATLHFFLDRCIGEVYDKEGKEKERNINL